ncbi:MAG: GNAT family N-acetyltransferase [Akkermansiaceae bacterium]
MRKFYSATMLLPLLKGQKNVEPLVHRFLNASDIQKERILEQATELTKKPVIKDFHFPTEATKTKNNLRHYDGYATATQTVLERADFRKKEIKMEMSLLKEVAGRFQFILQSGKDGGHIVACKVAKNHRGKGLFATMVEAMTKYAFDDLGLRSLTGTASPPRTEPENDWRCDKVAYRQNFETGEIVELTKLHKLWLSQKYAVHGKVVGSDEAESFALLNPKFLSDLPMEELVFLDDHHPKSEENTFVKLLGRGAA